MSILINMHVFIIIIVVVVLYTVYFCQQYSNHIGWAASGWRSAAESHINFHLCICDECALQVTYLIAMHVELSVSL